MKRKTAKEILIESFLELAEHQAVDKISIKDIAGNCGYSTATFYRQFKDKYDLIAYDYSSRVQRIIERMDEKGYSFEDMVTDGMNLYEKNKNYLINLLLHTSGLDSFTRNMVEVNYNFLSQRVSRSKGSAKLDEAEEIYVRFYCVGCVAVICDWILGRYLADKKELIQILVCSLPSTLHKYFLHN